MPIDKAEPLEVLKVFGRAFNKAGADGILGQPEPLCFFHLKGR